MEGAEYKFWIEKLNQMFTKHKVNGWEFWGNDMQNLWGGPYVFGNNGTFESDEKRQAFIDAHCFTRKLRVVASCRVGFEPWMSVSSDIVSP